MKYECKTISKSVVDIIQKEKGSKFIGYAYYVRNEGDVKKRLEEVKSIHPSATHHCYAYRLGFAGKKYRANDDGEPNGTAGLPIYNQLLSFDYTFTLVVVVRYYGGTKLGVSGLIKAYKNCAEETLQLAKTKILEKKERHLLVFPYSSQGDAMRIIDRYNGDMLTQSYMAECEIEVEVSKRINKEFLEHLEAFQDIEIYECD